VKAAEDEAHESKDDFGKRGRRGEDKPTKRKKKNKEVEEVFITRPGKKKNSCVLFVERLGERAYYNNNNNNNTRIKRD